MMQSITFDKRNRIYIYIYIYISLVFHLFVAHKLDATTFPYIFVGGASTSGAVINNSNSVVGFFSTSGLGSGITSMVITSNNKFAYIGNQINSGTVSINYINLENVSDITTISLGIASVVGGDTYLALTPDGNYIYAIYNQSLSVISTATNTLIATNVALTNITTASGIAITPDGTQAFVIDGGSRNVLSIAIGGGGVPGTQTSFLVGSVGNFSLAFSPDGTTLYVASNDQHLYLVNPANPMPPFTGIPSGGGLGTFPTSTVIAPNGNTAYEVDLSTGKVFVVNLTTQSLTTSITMPGSTAYAGAITSDGSLLYVTDTSPMGFTNRGVTVVNTATNTVSTTINLSFNQNISAIAIANVSSGTLDITFGNNGFTLTPVSRADTAQGTAIHVAPYDTDEILVAGSSLVKFDPSLFIGQYTASGFLDTSGFNSSGSTPGYQTLLPTGATASLGNAVTTDSNGNVLVAGFSAQNPTAMVLARYTSAGVLDTTFPNGSGPGYTTFTIGSGFTANAIGLQTTGKIIVAGTSVVNGKPLFTVARFSSAGVLDNTFGSSGVVKQSFGNISILKGITIPTSSTYQDNIFAVGGVDNQALIAQYDTNGNVIQSLLQPLSTANVVPIIPSSSIAYAVAWDPNNNDFYMVGSALVSGIMQAVIMAYKPSSNILDPNFNLGTFNPVGGYTLQPVANGSEYFSVALDSNGNIVCGGYARENLANQLLLERYLGFSWGSGRSTNDWGFPDFYFNNNNIQLTTIGSVTAAQGVGIQSTNNIITAGTADGTFCVARFNS